MTNKFVLGRIVSLLHFEEDAPQFLRALLSPFLLLLPFIWLPSNLAGKAIVWVAIWLSIAKLNYVLHNHIHVPFAYSKRLNRWLDWSLGFCTGMTAGNWRLTHVHAHHVEHLKHKLKGRKVFFEFQEHKGVYTVGKAALHCITSAFPQFWLPLREGWCKGVCGQGFRSVLFRYVFWEIIGVYTLVTALFVYKPVIAFFYVLLPYVFIYLISRHVDFITHTDTQQTRFGYSSVCVLPKYNARYWNFGYHLAHHENPRIHWSKLPQAFNSMNMEKNPQIPMKKVLNWTIFPKLYSVWYFYQKVPTK